METAPPPDQPSPPGSQAGHPSSSASLADRLPLPAAWSVRKGREVYLAENGFTLSAYDAAWTQASFLGIRLAVPNTRRHRFAIMMHDLHHVATGYGTDHTGEGEISAWELRRGLAGLGLYVGGIVVSGALFGLLCAPRRTWAAFRAGGSRPSLFAQDDVEKLLDLTIGELRHMLGLPAQGLATAPRGLHVYAPAAAPGAPAAAMAAAASP